MNLKKIQKKINETKRNYNEKNEGPNNKKKIRYEIEKKINQKKGEKQNKYQLQERGLNLTYK